MREDEIFMTENTQKRRVYEEPEVKVVSLGEQDVIATSGPFDDIEGEILPVKSV